MLNLVINKVLPRLYTVKHNQESRWGEGGNEWCPPPPGGKINIINERKLFSALIKFSIIQVNKGKFNKQF